MPQPETSVRVPAGHSRVSPWVISPDTDAEIAFLQAVFGAQERPGSRMVDATGAIGHVEVALGDAVLMLFDRKPGWSPAPAAIRVYVEDAEAAVERALALGARTVTRVTELAFGERVARVRDPQGHLWWIHERVEELEPEEMTRRFSDPAYQEAMGYVQESLAAELASGGAAADPATPAMRLEVVPVPVADVDAAKRFYTESVGFALDHDVRPGPGMRVVQMTPPGSACSVVLGEGLPLGEPGSVKGVQLVVEDVDAVRAGLAARGVPVSEVQLLGREGDPGSRFCFFSDPDGNGWAVQELRRG